LVGSNENCDLESGRVGFSFVVVVATTATSGDVKDRRQIEYDVHQPHCSIRQKHLPPRDCRETTTGSVTYVKIDLRGAGKLE
jgi:hypothetical protein